MKFFIVIKEKSQRIKKKNFVKLGNKELWKHLILELKGQEVFLDTDSNKIISECKKKFPGRRLFAISAMADLGLKELKESLMSELALMNKRLNEEVDYKREVIDLETRISRDVLSRSNSDRDDILSQKESVSLYEDKEIDPQVIYVKD